MNLLFSDCDSEFRNVTKKIIIYCRLYIFYVYKFIHRHDLKIQSSGKTH